MPSQEMLEARAGCTRFISRHYPRSVSEHLREIAEHPWAALSQDMYGQGGAVAELEAEVGILLGKEAAVLMPSGTMAQQIALRIWCDRAANPRIAYHPTCHLELHEQMGYRELHRLEATLLGGPDQLFTVDDLKGVNGPIAALLIELPQREIGGQLPTWEELTAVCREAQSRGTVLHMDGARLWECAPFFARSYAGISAPFDSVYVSLYKILGGLAGAVLAGPSDLIEAARVWQRRHGGNLIQQSPNAIAAKIGMDKHLPRIPEYVAKAGEIADVLRGFDRVRIVPERPPTNMMHLHFDADAERLNEASLRIALEDKVFLFFFGGEGTKMELTIGEAALDLTREEIESLFTKLLDLAS